MRDWLTYKRSKDLFFWVGYKEVHLTLTWDYASIITSIALIGAVVLYKTLA